MKENQEKILTGSRMACPSNYRRQSRWGSAAGPPASHGSRVHIFYRISVACPRLVKSWQTRQWPGSMDAPWILVLWIYYSRLRNIEIVCWRYILACLDTYLPTYLPRSVWGVQHRSWIRGVKKMGTDRSCIFGSIDWFALQLSPRLPK